jgi:intracellular septation protein A
VKENLSKDVLVITGYAWAGLMFILGLSNLYVAANYSLVVWGYFIAFGATGAKGAAFFAQYLVFQILIRRRLAANAPGIARQVGPQTNG